MESAQESFNRLLARCFSEVQGSGHFFLVLKIEPIAFSSRQMMQTISDVADEIQSLSQGLKFIMRQETIILEVSELFQIRLELGDPEHGVIIPQSAPAFLEVGFEKIGGITEIFMPQPAVFNQFFYDLVRVSAGNPFPKLCH